ncbi:hypothetical protein [Salibacterium qingdaonense]|uniref:Uncharacterized protein n=1 Tax=Salibacterium qingdaonense TaxID=266892 RepID=A0A1I4K4D9_9BACI|nr:hypothetical protein [Salibacterium qingdaonense]SFL73457.1 hypothetical protein SAMN04488054_10499 [Salibacterium qingdaonense]
MLWFFNWLSGYRKNVISFTLNHRYDQLDEYGTAVEQELTARGYDAVYEGDRYFLIDGRSYLLQGYTLPMGGVPMQRTVLKPM